MHDDPLGEQIAGVKSADRGESDEAIRVDVGHHQADFVHVRGEHDSERFLVPAGGSFQPNDVPRPISPDFVAYAFQLGHDKLLDVILEAGHAGDRTQGLQ